MARGWADGCEHIWREWEFLKDVLLLSTPFKLDDKVYGHPWWRVHQLYKSNLHNKKTYLQLPLEHTELNLCLFECTGGSQVFCLCGRLFLLRQLL